MNRLDRSARHRNGHWRPRYEWLEARRLLSLSVVATDPIPGARLTRGPAALTVKFNHPLDPTSIGFSDIQLDRVADDGSLNSLDDATESPGPHDDQLDLTPGQALAPGHYRMILAGDSSLQDTDGEGLDGTGTDQALGDFWVVAKGIGLGDALDLGTPGPIPTSTPGTLDFLADPNAVKLYKITLPAGHFWRLGLEVTAQRDGGTLDSALALFDARGAPIATDENGRIDAPKDPNLFAGLGAGTYYVGVSGTGNLPGTLDGYDPAAATPGSVAQAQAGGPFTLHMVADPEDTPTRLLGFTLDQADPLVSTPTGLTLQFSGAIRDDSLSHGIEVVDQGGHAWPVAGVSYSEPDARISFLFEGRLPEGHYTIRLPDKGGLVDLAGLAPIAPGRPAGILGTFSFGPSNPLTDPHDLGALLPGAALAGIGLDAQLSPGESVTYRIVITFASTYTFQAHFSGGSIVISRTGPDGTFAVDPGRPDVVNPTNDTILKPGIYQIRMTATGSQPVLVHLDLKTPSFSPESLLANGVGQGPALSLRLIAPSVSNPPPPPAPPPSPTPRGTPAPLMAPAPLPSTATTDPQSGSPPALLLRLPPPPPAPVTAQPAPAPDDATPPGSNHSPGNGTGSFSTVPTPGASQRVLIGLFLGPGGDLVGRPPLDLQHAAASSLVTRTGVIDSSIGIGILQGIGPEFVSRGSRPSDGPILPEAGLVLASQTDGAMVAASMLPMRFREEPLQLDRGWLVRLGTAIAPWFSGPPRDTLGADSGDELVGRPDPVEAEHAGVTSDSAFGLSVALITLSSYWMNRWLHRERCQPARRVGLTIRSESTASGGRKG